MKKRPATTPPSSHQSPLSLLITAGYGYFEESTAYRSRQRVLTRKESAGSPSGIGSREKSPGGLRRLCCPGLRDPARRCAAPRKCGSREMIFQCTICRSHQPAVQCGIDLRRASRAWVSPRGRPVSTRAGIVRDAVASILADRAAVGMCVDARNDAEDLSPQHVESLQIAAAFHLAPVLRARIRSHRARKRPSGPSQDFREGDGLEIAEGVIYCHLSSMAHPDGRGSVADRNAICDALAGGHVPTVG